MSLESFTLVSLQEEFLVKLMADNLHKTVEYKYPYERCIAQIELTLRNEYKERAYHEFNKLPVKSTYYDEEQQKFVDSGRILIRTDYFDFTLYQGGSHSVNLKKHSRDNSFALPFEETDVEYICEGLTNHYIKIPKTFEVDLIANIAEGKTQQLSKTVSYPPEEGLMANVADKVNHWTWGLFKKSD